MGGTVVIEEHDAHGLPVHDAEAQEHDCGNCTRSAGSAEAAGTAEAGSTSEACVSASPAAEGAGGEATQATSTAVSTEAEPVRLSGRTLVAGSCWVM